MACVKKAENHKKQKSKYLKEVGITLESNPEMQLRIVFSQDFTSDETEQIVESFSKILPTKESRMAVDSAEAVAVATAVIVFLIFEPIAEGFLKSIGSDLYNKAKEKIIKILDRKKNPTILFQFKSAHKGTDIVIKAQTNAKEELNIIFDTIDKARELAIRDLVTKELMVTVNYDEGWTLESETENQVRTEKVGKFKEKTMLLRPRLDRLNIFEAVVVGIYGNWLISFLDKLTLTNIEVTLLGIPIPYFQAFNLAFAFTALFIFFGFTIFRPNEVTRKFAIIMGIAHIVGIWVTMLFEVMTIKFGLSYWLGIGLYLVLFSTEISRVRLTRRNRP